MPNQLLLIITQVAGILLLVSTVILLFFGRVYLDAATKEPITFTLPVLGNIKTQSPVMALILIAAFMVVYPISRSGPDRANLHGHLETGGKHVSAYVVAVPDYEFGQDAKSDDYSVDFPLLPTTVNYRVLFVADGRIIDDQRAVMKDRQIALKPVSWYPPLKSLEDAITPRKDIADSEVQAVLR
jgi:hypothetical protein